jgi:hypothetical protein
VVAERAVQVSPFWTKLGLMWMLNALARRMLVALWQVVEEYYCSHSLRWLVAS